VIRGEGRALAVGVVALALMAAFAVVRVQVNTNITHFLPGGDEGSKVQIAKSLVGGELSRTMILIVDGADSASVVDAGRALEAALRAEPRVAKELATLEGGSPTGMEESLWSLYQSKRLGFFAPSAAEVKALTTSDALLESVARLKGQLAGPLSSLIGRVAPEDPTLILPALFESMQGGSGNSLRMHGGRFITADGTGAVLFLTSKGSATNAPLQRPFLAGVNAAFEEVQQNAPGKLALSISGTNRFAIRAEESIRSDVQRVSIGSVLGLLLLLLIIFRSLGLTLLVLPIVASGFLSGLCACLALFDSVHGLTLAFGAAITGVSIDYAIHFHCHQVHAPHPNGPRHTLNHIWKGLALGAATTITGFLAILISGFPGLRELAVFATAGILGSLMATRFFLPGLAVQAAPPAGTQRLIRAGARMLSQTGPRRYLLWLPTTAVLVVVLLGLPKLSWNDGISDMNRLDPEILAEDEAVRGRVMGFEQGRLVVAIGDDVERALQVNDRVAHELGAAQMAGELRGSRNLAAMLPSAATQTAVVTQLRADTGLWLRLRDALESEGFVSAGFEPFHKELLAPIRTPLVFADLSGSPLASLVRPFRVTLGERVGIVSFLHELHDEPALRARLDAIPGAELIDIEGTLTGAFGAYRDKMWRLSLVGLLAVVALVAIRHRALRPTVTACVPAILAAAGTVAILSLCGFQLNVLSLVALLMVISMGVDYGVFLTEAGSDQASLEATYLAVFVAGASTLIGFGLLAFSDQPPLFSIGATAGIGVTLCAILAPTWNALLPSKA
jgi:predicted exporter